MADRYKLTTMRIQRYFDDAGVRQYRFLVRSNDEEITPFFEDWENSYHPLHKNWQFYKAVPEFWHQTVSNVRDFLGTISYEEVGQDDGDGFGSPTERNANTGERGERYAPGTTNFVTLFSPEGVDYEYNYEFIRMVEE